MKAYSYIGAVLIAVGLIIAAYFEGQQAGADAAKAEWQAKALKEHEALEIMLANERELRQKALDELAAEKIKREVIYRDRIKTVREIVAVDDCGSRDMPDALYQQLLDADQIRAGEAGSRIDTSM